MGSKNNMLILDLNEPGKTTKKSLGKVIIRSETVSTLNDFITMQLSCKNLQFNNLCCGPGKPFIVVSKARMTNT